jgi:hypothetical protein
MKSKARLDHGDEQFFNLSLLVHLLGNKNLKLNYLLF